MCYVTHYNAELWEQCYEVSCVDPVYEFRNQLRLADGETRNAALLGQETRRCYMRNSSASTK